MSEQTRNQILKLKDEKVPVNAIAKQFNLLPRTVLLLLAKMKAGTDTDHVTKGLQTVKQHAAKILEEIKQKEQNRDRLRSY
ncbi:hypothetical protein, partial [Enterococcus faecium]